MSWAKVQSFGRELVSNPITRALVVSILLHVAGIAGVELGRQLGWWERSLFSSLVKNDLVNTVVKTAEQRAELQRKMMQQQPPPEAELVFVDVDPNQAAAEAPKDAKYYSSHNTVAANRTRDTEKNTPRIEGKQDNVAKTMDTLRPDTRAPQPTPPAEKAPPQKEAPPPQPQPQPVPPPPKTPEPVPPVRQPQPEPAQEKGETLLAKVVPREELRPQPQPNNPPPQEQPRKRPRSVAEARSQAGLLEGPKMRQQGGVGRIAAEGLDVKATPFGTYDAMFIEAVQSRWFSLLDDRDFVGNQAGRVTVEFRLHADGRITDLNIVASSVNELLSWFCQRAILDPSPYRPFPPDLRRMMNSDYREIRFTFYYNQ